MHSKALCMGLFMVINHPRQLLQFLLPRHKGGFEVRRTSSLCLEALHFGHFRLNGMIWCSTMKDGMSMQ
jgi:hypothetical protein